MLGFTLHNITEGIGIAAPMLKEPPPLSAFVGLALLAGGPAVVGMWIGSLAFARNGRRWRWRSAPAPSCR